MIIIKNKQNIIITICILIALSFNLYSQDFTLKTIDYNDFRIKNNNYVNNLGNYFMNRPQVESKYYIFVPAESPEKGLCGNEKNRYAESAS
jgi:hypothetical protein